MGDIRCVFDKFYIDICFYKFYESFLYFLQFFMARYSFYIKKIDTILNDEIIIFVMYLLHSKYYQGEVSHWIDDPNL